MLKAIRVSAMLLVLVGSAYAGEVLTPPAPQPPPTNAQTADSNTIATSSLIQTVVAVIVSVLP
jgi:hypothetical protein